MEHTLNIKITIGTEGFDIGSILNLAKQMNDAKEKKVQEKEKKVE